MSSSNYTAVLLTSKLNKNTMAVVPLRTVMFYG